MSQDTQLYRQMSLLILMCLCVCVVCLSVLRSDLVVILSVGHLCISHLCMHHMHMDSSCVVRTWGDYRTFQSLSFLMSLIAMGP